MAFVIDCDLVLISSTVISGTNHNSAAVFLIRCNGYLRLLDHYKTVISHGQLHYGRRPDGNRKLAVSVPLWNRKLK